MSPRGPQQAINDILSLNKLNEKRDHLHLGMKTVSRMLSFLLMLEVTTGEEADRVYMEFGDKERAKLQHYVKKIWARRRNR